MAAANHLDESAVASRTDISTHPQTTLGPIKGPHGQEEFERDTARHMASFRDTAAIRTVASVRSQPRVSDSCSWQGRPESEACSLDESRHEMLTALLPG